MLEAESLTPSWETAITMEGSLTLGQISELVQGTLHGDADIEIRSVAPIQQAAEGDLTWVTDKRYAAALPACEASAALIAPDLDFGRMPVVVCDRPDLAIAATLDRLAPPKPLPPAGADSTAVIDEDVELGADAAIGPHVVLQRGVHVGARTVLHAGVFVGAETVIGEGCIIWPNVVIRERTVIGSRVIIHPNTTIGADGFGYNFHNDQYTRIPHIGRVRIEDDVEIGANTCIDRAKTYETVIGRGTKIDNLVQIAHNVKIGPHGCIIAHAGIAGSTELGHHVMLAGKVGIKDNITIGDQVVVAACSCVARNVHSGDTVLGNPAEPKERFYREHSALRRLPRTTDNVRDLLKRVERLEAAHDKKDG